MTTFPDATPAPTLEIFPLLLLLLLLLLPPPPPLLLLLLPPTTMSTDPECQHFYYHNEGLETMMIAWWCKNAGELPVLAYQYVRPTGHMGIEEEDEERRRRRRKRREVQEKLAP